MQDTGMLPSFHSEIQMNVNELYLDKHQVD